MNADAANAPAERALPVDLRRRSARRVWKFGLLAGGLVVLLLAALAIGSVPVPLPIVLKLLQQAVWPWAEPVPVWTDAQAQIILEIRLPRVLLAALIGACLAVAGAAFQGMFRNPMADPYVLGVSSGSSLGAVLMLFFRLRFEVLGLSVVPLAAFAGGLVTVYVVYLIARDNGRVPVMSLLLVGIAVGAFLGAVVSRFVYLAGDRMPPLVYWLMGSLSGTTWLEVRTVASYTLPVLALLTLYSRDLNALLLGEEAAHHLGVEPERLKRMLLVLATLLTASAVSVSGVIGFVGLIVPHAIRLITGPDHRVLVPAAALGGAGLLVVCDAIARTVLAPTELPVGILTAMAGGPFFLYLLRRRRRLWRGLA